MANPNTNKTTSNTQGNDLSPTMKNFYDRKLLKDANPKIVHAQFGQKRPIPNNEGKTIQFRKWTQFAENITALTEGVTPDGHAMNQTALTATVAQYGDYVTVSDLLCMTALDPIIGDAVELNANQAGTSIDSVTRDVIAAGTNVIYAAGAERSAIAATDVFSSTLIRKAVRTLKKQNAPMFSDGGREHYVGIVGPDTVYDLQSDSAWLDVSKYQDKKNIYTGEIGMLYGVRFVETTKAKVYEAENIMDASSETGHVHKKVVTMTTISSDAYVISGSTYTLQVTATATELGANGIADIGDGTHFIVVAGQKIKISSAEAAATASNGTILTLDAKIGSYASKSADLNGITVYGPGGGKTANDIGATLIFGRDAYGVVDLGSVDAAGNKAFEVIVKPKGAGDDPLNQRATVGWKAPGYTAAILNQAWLVRVEHGMTDR